MRSELFAASNQEVQSGERFVKQSAKMLKVTLGPDVLALKGSMVAFQGQVTFNHEGSGGVGKFLKRALTNEDTPLMRVAGQGEVFFAHANQDIFFITLEGEGLSVNGENLLAFDSSLQWDVHRVKGAGMFAGGAFNTLISGHGTVAITTDGPPMILDCSQPTYVDTQAAVAWAANLQPQMVSSANFKSLLRGGTGELAQLAFHGPGFVVVQPSEGPIVPPHDHGGGGGGGGLGSLFE